MPVVQIPTSAATFVGTTPGETYQLARTATITTAGDGIRDFTTRADAADSATWLIDGAITAGGIGVLTRGLNATLEIGATATLSTQSAGVSMAGANSSFRNDGAITVAPDPIFDLEGVDLRGAGSTGLNTGTITADGPAVRLIVSDGTTFVNTGTLTSREQSGLQVRQVENSTLENACLIEGASLGIEYLISTGTHRFTNSGTVTVSDGPRVFDGGDSVNIVVNTGLMVGNITLDRGDDVFNNRGGTVTGTIFGDAGADTILGGRGAETLVGGLGADRINGGLGADVISGSQGYDVLFGEGGDDLIRGGGGNDTLVGAFGADTLKGFGGDDILNGGAGNDVLVGGSGADMFEFILNAGDDRIFGWEDGIDLIDLSAYGTNTTALNAALSVDGANAVVDLSALGGAGTITVLRAADTLDAADFLL